MEKQLLTIIHITDLFFKHLLNFNTIFSYFNLDILSWRFKICFFIIYPSLATEPLILTQIHYIMVLHILTIKKSIIWQFLICLVRRKLFIFLYVVIIFFPKGKTTADLIDWNLWTIMLKLI